MPFAAHPAIVKHAMHTSMHCGSVLAKDPQALTVPSLLSAAKALLFE